MSQTNWHSQAWLLMGTLMWQMDHSISTDCPQSFDVYDALVNCLSNVTLNSLKVGDDIEEVDRKCRNGDYNASVACLQHLFIACSDNEEQVRSLHSWASIERIQHSFQTLCEYLTFYSNHSGCLMEQNSEIEACAVNVSHFVNSSHQTHEMQHVVRAYCHQQWATRDCVVHPVSRACGQDMGSLIAVIITGLIPPVCEIVDRPDFFQFVANSAQRIRATSLHFLLTRSLWACCWLALRFGGRRMRW